MIDQKDLGLVSNWLRSTWPTSSDKYADQLAKLPSADARPEKIVQRLNIIEQVRNVCESTIVEGAWKEGRELAVHGWAYGLKDGLLKDILKNPVTSVAESLKLP